MEEGISNNTPVNKAKGAVVFLVPCSLYEGINQTIPAYVLDAVKQCEGFFVENERTARRFLKSIWKEMQIDAYSWHTIHKAEAEVLQAFASDIKQNKTIGILSEAGCPGIADPGQLLVQKAQEMKATVKPLVGPSSILLSLMASGMNGQQFRFHGYLPIDAVLRKKHLQQLEDEALKKSLTQIFIETPFRNDAMLKDILASCKPTTRLCIAADITSPDEFIQTKKIQEWKNAIPALHKRPVIFLLGA